jgi:hypothetical protein
MDIENKITSFGFREGRGPRLLHVFIGGRGEGYFLMTETQEEGG